MGRNKKAKQSKVVDGSDCDSEFNDDHAIGNDSAPNTDSHVEIEESGAKKEKKLSKKALQRMEQQNRSAEAGGKGKGKKKKKGDSDSESDASGSDAAKDQAQNDISSSDSESEEDLPLTYPIKVTYCPNCTFPIEMCEFSGMFEKCKPFLIQLLGEEAVANASDKGRKRKVATEAEKLEAMLAREGKHKLEKHVVMDVKSRGNGRFTTFVRGLDLFGINLKDICKDFKKSFATGAGIASEPGKLDAVEIQGDFTEQIAELVIKKFNVPKDSIYKQDGKNTYPFFGEKPQKPDLDEKKKKASGKLALEQQQPDFESGEKITKAKIIVAEKREKVVKEEPERVRLFAPKVPTCFNCGLEGHISKDCPAPRAPRGGGGASTSGRGAGGAPRGGGASRGSDAGRGRGEGRGRGV